MPEHQSEWKAGTPVIQHQVTTQQRINDLVADLAQAGVCTAEQAWQLLVAADRVCAMGMWLTAHMTYASNVRLDGSQMQAQDFKPIPEGHTGGALNMVPAYVGYLLANALTGKTRAWMMGQGHSVAAIDAVNCLLRNLEPEQQQRYPFSDAGLSTLCRDFYGYAINSEGKPEAPLGSHVGVYTAGGISEGGYLGFAELQYVHMPLPGQELVSFLSDGAFEEQRGSDWTPRWWRGQDTGLVMPIMIANGRRIDQRTTMAQAGGVAWFHDHLALNGFSPLEIDGRDPAAFAWAVLTMANDLDRQYQEIQQGQREYPVTLPYTIAETEKGYGFYGAGTNRAHNLPLDANPHIDEVARAQFNDSAANLFVSKPKLEQAIAQLNNHARHARVQEKDHCLRDPRPPRPRFPDIDWTPAGAKVSPMERIDQWFCSFAKENAEIRFRIGNPDELRSNRMNKTLDLLKHRVVAPEPGIAESVDGSVITALNEEAVVSAALANKQGINLAVSYEAFAVKMLGVMRQEAIFARHFLEAGRKLHWWSVPVIATSHTWENGKNEQSHQDPTLAEAWMGEMADVAPVLFPVDANSAVTCLANLYRQTGRIATLVVPKSPVPALLNSEQAQQAMENGIVVLSHDSDAQIQLIAVGAYQLTQCIEAAACLRSHAIACSVAALVEPGRFRLPRDDREAGYVHSADRIASLLPPVAARVIVSHTRAESISGVLRPIDTGPELTRFLGYLNRGGTLDTFGMQFANKQTWAHVVDAACSVIDRVDIALLLSAEERAALNGLGNPRHLESRKK